MTLAERLAIVLDHLPPATFARGGGRSAKAQKTVKPGGKAAYPRGKQRPADQKGCGRVAGRFAPGHTCGGSKKTRDEAQESGNRTLASMLAKSRAAAAAKVGKVAQAKAGADTAAAKEARAGVMRRLVQKSRDTVVSQQVEQGYRRDAAASDRYKTRKLAEKAETAGFPRILAKSRAAAKRAKVDAPKAAAGGGKDTMVDAIALSSPGGKMSKRARGKAEERLRQDLFGKEGLKVTGPAQPAENFRLRQQAGELRQLAARGMKPKAYLKKAKELEAKAERLEIAAAPATTPWKNESMAAKTAERVADKKSQLAALKRMTDKSRVASGKAGAEKARRGREAAGRPTKDLERDLTSADPAVRKAAMDGILAKQRAKDAADKERFGRKEVAKDLKKTGKAVEKAREKLKDVETEARVMGKAGAAKAVLSKLESMKAEAGARGAEAAARAKAAGERAAALREKLAASKAAGRPVTPVRPPPPAVEARPIGDPVRLRAESSKMDEAFAKAPGARDNFVTLADLQKSMPHLSREEFVTVVNKGRDEGKYSLDSHEGLTGPPPPGAREAAFREAGSTLVYISRKRRS